MSNTQAAEWAPPRRADPYRDAKSLEFGFRQRRFERVARLIEAVIAEKGRCEILDLGGTENYWLIAGAFMERHAARLRVTMVNNERQSVKDASVFEFVQGSATEGGLLGGRRFDLVHSNSVVEHVGDWRRMQRFSVNVRRLAPRFYVQTPNYWFPYEPHFRSPGFQYLPRRLRVMLVMRYGLGFFQRIPDRETAEDVIDHHRLLSRRQMARLFPDAEISYERVAGLRKSILAIGGPALAKAPGEAG